MKGLLLKMEEAMGVSSYSERLVINYLLDHLEDVPAYSIHRLADEMFVSTATILRVCKKIGVRGYREFRDMVIGELALGRRHEKAEQKELVRSDSLPEIAKKISENTVQNLENSVKLLDYDVLEECVALLCACRTISFFGIGASLCVARDAYLKFLRLAKPCSLNDDWHSQLLQARNMNAQDVGVVISYSGQTEEVVACMEAMRECKAPIIAITRYAHTPIAQRATHALYVPNNESVFRSGAMSSRISQLNLVDILFTAYTNRTLGTSMDTLDKTHIYKPDQRYPQQAQVPHS